MVSYTNKEYLVKMTKLIKCKTMYGKEKLIPCDKLFFRPGVYGIIVHENKILLLKMRKTEKYVLPGGAVELGETLEEALLREIKEETGLKIKIVKLFNFREKFFYYDLESWASHSLSFFYICKPVSLEEEAEEKEIDGGAVEKPKWYNIDSLKPDDFQGGGKTFRLFLRDRI